MLQAVLYAIIAVVLAPAVPDLPRAAELVAERRFDEAEALIDRILAQNPGEADALNLRGVVAAEKGEPAAKSWFEKAIAANPKLAAAHANLGYLLRKTGQKEQALASFLKAAELVPGDPEALLNAAILLADEKRFPEAVETLSGVSEELRTPDHWEVLGRLCLSAGRQPEARRAYEKVLEKKPESVETLRVLSGLALKAGDSRGAWSHIARARQLAPHSPQILYEFGYIGLANNYVHDAAMAFRRAILMDGTRPEYYAGLIDSLMRTTDYPMASGYVEKYIALRPEDPWGHFVKGQLLFLAGKLDEAVPHLQKSGSMNPGQADPPHLLGRIAYEKGEFDQAEAYFRQALRNDPDHAPTHLRLGMLHLRKQDYEAAEKELRRSSELDPREPLTQLQMSLLLARTGKSAEAAQAAELHRKLKAEEQQRRGEAPPPLPSMHP